MARQHFKMYSAAHLLGTIMTILHEAIMEADEDKANTALLLLKKYEEEYVEEEVQMLDSIEERSVSV
mgnify:CR=1 FL=1